MKTLKTVTITALSTLSLSVVGFGTYTYLQPTHYQGETFNNETSSTSSSFCKCQKDETSKNNQEYNTETQTETVKQNDPYSLIGTQVGNSCTVVEYYNGYYIVDRPEQTGIGVKYMYSVYNPQTDIVQPWGTEDVQEVYDWIDNYGQN